MIESQGLKNEDDTTAAVDASSPSLLLPQLQTQKSSTKTIKHLDSISDHIQNGYYRQIKHSPDDLCFSVTERLR